MHVSPQAFPLVHILQQYIFAGFGLVVGISILLELGLKSSNEIIESWGEWELLEVKSTNPNMTTNANKEENP